MFNLKIYFQFITLVSFIAFISCDDSITDPNKLKEAKVPDYHTKITTHYHSPCEKVANTKTTDANVSARNINALVRSKDSYLYNQNVKLIITPPDCRTGGTVVEPKKSYTTRVVGFTMLQFDEANNKWVTTPPEYVAYHPTNK
ncbi:MAG: hypothetical protein R2753_05855 [Chitinophagales bacterium]